MTAPNKWDHVLRAYMARTGKTRDEAVATMVNMYEVRGMSLTAIQQEFGYANPAPVRSILIRRGVKMRRPGRPSGYNPIPPEQRNSYRAARELRKRGHTWRFISEALNTPIETLRNGIAAIEREGF